MVCETKQCGCGLDVRDTRNPGHRPRLSLNDGDQQRQVHRILQRREVCERLCSIAHALVGVQWEGPHARQHRLRLFRRRDDNLKVSLNPTVVIVREGLIGRRPTEVMGDRDAMQPRSLESPVPAQRNRERKLLPGLEFMEFNAVFAPSAQPLGVATDLGFPVPVWDSFLTLYHPYWSSFSRWFHVMYPTDEERFRDALAQAPYDYPFILTDSSEFWGTGNYNAYTVVPANIDSFEYLVLHEFGHYFGLNEEYSGQGTELLFADGVSEPRSQNMTFQLAATDIKWNSLIGAEVPIPTPGAQWPRLGIGAYAGGYAGEDARSLIPVPDGVCTMSSGVEFCDVCAAAMREKLEADLAP